MSISAPLSRLFRQHCGAEIDILATSPTLRYLLTNHFSLAMRRLKHIYFDSRLTLWSSTRRKRALYRNDVDNSKPISIVCRFTGRFRRKEGPEINEQAIFDVESASFLYAVLFIVLTKDGNFSKTCCIIFYGTSKRRPRTIVLVDIRATPNWLAWPPSACIQYWVSRVGHLI